jgi:hypothetical protein
MIRHNLRLTVQNRSGYYPLLPASKGFSDKCYMHGKEIQYRPGRHYYVDTSTGMGLYSGLRLLSMT